MYLAIDEPFIEFGKVCNFDLNKKMKLDFWM